MTRTAADRHSCSTAAAIGLGGALALGVATASANGRYPAANQLTVSPSDSKALVLRTTFGLLVSRDGGMGWDWICEQAIGYAGSLDPAIGVMANGNVLVGAFEGLFLSPDAGCSWRAVDRNPVVDLVVRGSAPHEALAVTSAFSGTREGGTVFASHLLATTDDGAHWTQVGPSLDPTLVLMTIEVAQSDARRVYLSGHRTTSTGSEGLLLASSDGGATFSERSIPLDAATETDAYIAAVDPQNADLVYLRTGAATIEATTRSRLLVTADAGKSYIAPFAGGPMLGFALSADGAKVYLGGPNDGLQVATKAGYVFRQTSTLAVQCLRARGTSLYVCSSDSAGFTLGETVDDGSTIAPKLHLTDIRGPLACPTMSSAAVCRENWPLLQQQLGIGIPAPDAGTTVMPDAADSHDASLPAPIRRSSPTCSCRVVGARERSSADAACAVMTCLLALRLRKKNSRPSNATLA